jgi:O-acetyl-ADP-ribose deacetylase (regulator of RNase III)
MARPGGTLTLLKRTVGDVTVEAVRGDITSLEVDAVVNAANDHLWMGAGVAGAIKRRGGEGIEREAVAKGPIPVGTAVETSAGALGARHVIHAAVMGQDLRTDLPTVARTTRAVLELAGDLGAAVVAMPLLGTGVGGLDLGEVAVTMVGEVAALARSGTCRCERVLVVAYDEVAAEAVRAAVGAI